MTFTVTAQTVDELPLWEYRTLSPYLVLKLIEQHGTWETEGPGERAGHMEFSDGTRLTASCCEDGLVISLTLEEF